MRDNRSRRERWGLTLAAMGLVAACADPLDTPIANADLQEMESDYVTFGMVSFLTTRGVREGRISADTAYMFEDSASAHLRGMEIVFYDEDGRERATVTGTTGQWSWDTDRMVARGDVVLIVHSDGSKLESQEIYYDPDLDRIWSDSATVQTFADGTVTSGSSFESDMSFENILIRDPRGGSRRIF